LVDCWLPYGETEVYVSVELENHLETLIPQKNPREEKIEIKNEIQTALVNPTGGLLLSELVKPNSSVSIAIDGSMDPILAINGLEAITSRLVELKVPRERVTIILGNGFRENTGGAILSTIRNNSSLNQITLVNNTRNSSNYVDLGNTSRGTPVIVRREYIDASIKIAIGQTQIDPHTGFNGAFSAILPGISSIKTIEANRRYYFQGEIYPGQIENNPIKEDALEAVSKAGVDLALNFTVDYDGECLDTHTGGYKETWRKAINSLGSGYEVKTSEKADITIVGAGGLNHDFNLYKAVWALENAIKVTKRNGTIILVAECKEGLGTEAFTKLSRVRELSEFERRFTYGAEALQKIRKNTRVNNIILVSALPSYLTDPLEFTSARTLNEGYERAIESRRARQTLVIPYGCTTIIVFQ
jgi:nickel-dependent lactate racemase